VSEGGFAWRESAGVRILAPAFADELGLAGGYSTRRAESGEDLDLDLRGGKGRSIVLAARRRVATAMGVDAGHLVIGQQVHGAEAIVVSKADRGRGAASASETVCGADALATAAAGIPLCALAADCAIVLLADDHRRAVAAVHSGRRGTVLNVVAAAVRALGELGAPPEALFAAVGPAIGQCCYEVGAEVEEEFGRAFPWGGEVMRSVAGRPHLDLAGAIGRQLADAGVRTDRIFQAGLCTVCRNDLFFSYRKEGAAAGRFTGVIAIRE
jgi:hypothetical protein